nr:MAG TPA: hypothetical protein [Caudoviricetes sp.]
MQQSILNFKNRVLFCSKIGYFLALKQGTYLF